MEEIRTPKENYAKENYIYPLGLTIIAFVCFLLVYLYFLFGYKIPLIFSPLLLLTPAIIFGIITLLIKYKNKCVTLLNLIAIILTPVLAFSSFVYTLYIGDIYPVENVKHYERIMKNNDIKVFEIFPKEIPDGYTIISFYYNEEGFQDYSYEGIVRFKVSEEVINNFKINYESYLADISSLPHGNKLGNNEVITEDYLIYNIYSGFTEYSLILIDEKSSEMIFYGYYFTM